MLCSVTAMVIVSVATCDIGALLHPLSSLRNFMQLHEGVQNNSASSTTLAMCHSKCSHNIDHIHECTGTCTGLDAPLVLLGCMMICSAVQVWAPLWFCWAVS